jgi:hypothetical protein
MKIYVVVSTFRQEAGSGSSALTDVVGVKLEKGFQDELKAKELAEKLSQVLHEQVQTPQGIIQVGCERAVQPVEVEL